jgi:hypothetical protein
MCGHVATHCMHMNNSSTSVSAQVATGESSQDHLLDEAHGNVLYSQAKYFSKTYFIAYC